MFRRPSSQLAQMDNASEAVRAEVDNSSECFDDATDTTQENSRPQKTRSVSYSEHRFPAPSSKRKNVVNQCLEFGSVSFLLHNAGGVASKCMTVTG